MSDELFELAFSRASKIGTLRSWNVGKKCIVREVGKGWYCARGINADEVTAHETDKKFAKAKGKRATDALMHPYSTQSKIFFKYEDDNNEPTVLVVPYHRYAFRKSMKGLNKSSVSFDKNRNPVLGVLLLYALKTGQEVDRIAALAAMSMQDWETYIFPESLIDQMPEDQMYGLMYHRDEPIVAELLDEMQSRSDDLFLYNLLVGGMMASDAILPGGLHKWHTYEITVDKVLARNETLSDEQADSLFFRAVKHMAVKRGGLPSLRDVRELLAGEPDKTHVEFYQDGEYWEGAWEPAKKRLGFEWLPSIHDWKKHWPPINFNSNGGTA